MVEQSHERRKPDKFPQEVKDYIDAAAELGAEKAMERLYAEIGKAGIRKILLLVGTFLAALLSWLGWKGYLPK